MVPEKIIDYANTKESFYLKYCEELDCYQTKPIPVNLDKYYSTDNYISHTDTKETTIDKLYQYVKKFAIKSKTNLITSLSNKKSKSILDIGCGTGSFLEFTNKRGWVSCGVEPNNLAREKAIDKKVNCFSNTDEIINIKFDIITMWHVLEHVPDLKLQFAEIDRLLLDEGTLIIAVPNYKSFDADYYKQFWAAYDVPRHIWHFSENSIKILAETFGFKLIRTKPMYFDAFYVSILSEQFKNKTNLIKALTIGLFSNIKAFFTSEYSSKVYILRKSHF